MAPLSSRPAASPAVGLSTKSGLAGAIAAFVAAVALFIEGDHSIEAASAMVTAGGILYGVIRSRGAQQEAITLAQADAQAGAGSSRLTS